MNMVFRQLDDVDDGVEVAETDDVVVLLEVAVVVVLQYCYCYWFYTFHLS